ncbi:MAG: hypothetical protein J7578_24755, partial [Chitinophagaceae bacterium]|nr:hypothetical protein [Chitinophagaceae bacterium]
QSSAIITAKNNSIKLTTPDNCQPSGETNENYYCTDGQYKIRLNRTNPSNGLNIRSAYWIYRFL